MPNKLDVASPWVTFARKIYMLFAEDPDVRCEWNNEDLEMKIFVENPIKAEALDRLLPDTKQFGNVTMTITIIPANDNISKTDLFKTAFAGNPAVSYVESVDAYGQTFNYVVFEKEVVQYYNDNMGDLHGVESTLYQDIAKEVFEDCPGIFFCTDIEEGLAFGTPLGEWP